jgi:phosphoserine aminotransferase
MPPTMPLPLLQNTLPWALRQGDRSGSRSRLKAANTAAAQTLENNAESTKWRKALSNTVALRS